MIFTPSDDNTSGSTRTFRIMNSLNEIMLRGVTGIDSEDAFKFGTIPLGYVTTTGSAGALTASSSVLSLSHLPIDLSDIINVMKVLILI